MLLPLLLAMAGSHAEPSPLPPVAQADEVDEGEFPEDLFDEDEDDQDQARPSGEAEQPIDVEEDPEDSLQDEEPAAQDEIQEDDLLPGDDDSLFGIEEDDAIGGEGTDTAEIYRQAQRETREMGPEEESLHWEHYLQTYPNTLFRDRVEERLDDLTRQQYAERIGPSGFEEDAGRREIDFAQGILLEPIDPRSRLRAGFEWGFPSYVDLLADAEFQLLRELSVHGGLRHRYTGWSAEAGTRYALVKSARTSTLLSGIFDLHLNTDPIFLGLRPQLAFGRRVDLAGGLDLQVQGGVDLQVRTPLTIEYVGGFNAFLHATDRVGVFLESSTNMKPGLPKGKPFAFNLLTFGMRFEPRKAPARISIAANVPYFQNYWGYHYGAVSAEVDYYM